MNDLRSWYNAHNRTLLLVGLRHNDLTLYVLQCRLCSVRQHDDRQPERSLRYSFIVQLHQN